MPELYVTTAIMTVGVLVSAYLVYRSKSRESQVTALANESANKVSANTTMVTGFSVLFETMRKQIDGAQTQIDDLRKQMRELQATYSTERETWQTERGTLERRIAALEGENATLKTTLKQLQDQNIALQATLEEIRKPTGGTASATAVCK